MALGWWRRLHHMVMIMQSPVLGSTALTDPTDSQQAGPLDKGHTMLHADLTPAIYGMLQSQQNL